MSSDTTVTIDGARRRWHVSPSSRSTPGHSLDDDASDEEEQRVSSSAWERVVADVGKGATASSSAWERLLAPTAPITQAGVPQHSHTAHQQSGVRSHSTSHAAPSTVA